MYGLLDSEIQNITQIFQKYTSVQEAILYGSRAMGNYRAGSDIDITLKGENISQKDLYNILADIEALYLPYKFDICIYADIDNQDLISQIDRVGRVL